jgi:hypothetical protein
MAQDLPQGFQINLGDAGRCGVGRGGTTTDLVFALLK